MTTCEHCGARAVNAHGVCEECGWRTSASGVAFDDSSPSLGETRAADVPYPPAEQRTGVARGTRPPNTPMPPLERTTGIPNQSSAPRTAADARQRYTTAAPTSTSRYCGTCGARIAPGEAFCGQCGTPVGAGGLAGTALQPAANPYEHYHIDSDSAWSAAEGDAPTEAFMPSSAQPYAHGFSSAPSARGGYAPASGATATPAGSSARTGRIIVGVICLAGSLASAVGAIVLALTR